MIDDGLRPNEAEKEFLTIAYSRFYDLYAEVTCEEFWQRHDQYRFSRITNGFAIYSELINYEPIKWVLEQMRIRRPPGESEIASDLFRFIRNVVFHYPFFDAWDDVWISGKLANWNKTNQSIDRFLRNYAGRSQIKYRIWEPKKKLMTYIRIRFPKEYSQESRIYLEDILEERDGTKFSFTLMKSIMNSQIEHQ